MSQYVTVEFAEIRKETDKAFLISFRDSDDECIDHWIPKSQIEDADRIKKGDVNSRISIAKWIADDKEIEYDEDNGDLMYMNYR